MKLWLFFLFCFCSYARDLNALFREGVEHQNANRLVHAVAAYREYLKLRPQASAVANRAAYCFEELGYPEIASRYFSQALEYDPSNQYAKDGLKRVLIKIKAQTQTEVLPEAPSITIGIRTEAVKEPEDTVVRRLYMLRNNQVYTMLTDGRDLRQFSEVVFGAITVPQKGFGFLSELAKDREHPDGGVDRDLFYYDQNSGLFQALSRIREDEYHPRYVNGKVWFLRRDGENSQLFHTPFDLKKEGFEEAQKVLEGFDSIQRFEIDRGTLWFSARKMRGEPFRIFRQADGTEPVPFIQGFDSYPEFFLSPKGDFLALQRVDSNIRSNFLLADPTKQERIPVLVEPVDEIFGVFSSDSERFYYSASRVSLKEGWDTVLCEFDIQTKHTRVLWKHNFLNRNLVLDPENQWIYLTSNYDNNFEIYRVHLSSLRRERLTISDADETQIGFWPLPSW